MNGKNDYAYWIALSHLPKWGNAKINRLIIDITEVKSLSFAEFFALNEAQWKQEFNLTTTQAVDIKKVKTDLPSYSFLAENLLEQGFQIIPLNSPDYSLTLRKNLTTRDAPSLLYVKGNTRLLSEDSTAIVGSRTASEKALEFTRNIAATCAETKQIVVSGFAKGVDKTALDATLSCNGRSIVVLPQGILTFGSAIRNYYKKIIAGDVLILSTFSPKAPWSAGLAMCRNAYIYGLAKTIYIAESENSGGTWSGAVEGLKRNRKIFIFNGESMQKEAHNMLIMQGAVPVDFWGNPLPVNGNRMEERLKTILAKGELTAAAINERLNMAIGDKDLQKLLTNLAFVDSKMVRNKKYYFLANAKPAQQELFSKPA